MTFRKSVLIFSLVFLADIFITYQNIVCSTQQNTFFVSGARREEPVFISPSPDGKVIMVVVDRLRLEDLDGEGLPNLHWLMEKGALGLMNCNTAGSSQNPGNTYATIGAGSHITATDAPGFGFSASDRFQNGPAATEYENRTGRSAPSEAVVHLGIIRIKKQNAGLPYPAVPGALGTALHSAGFKTAVLGNADVSSALRRQVVTIAMDQNGLVDYGRVDDRMLAGKSGFPGGLHTDYAKMLQELKEVSNQASFIVIETGDLSRLEEYIPYVSMSVLSSLRKRVLQELDSFLGQTLRFLDLEKDMLLVVAPTHSKMLSGKESSLTPVLILGGGLPEGFLLSPSTKRKGIILNTDLAPSILRYFNLPAFRSMLGQPVQALKGDNQLAFLASMQKQLILTYAARSPLQRGYIIYQLGLLIAGLYFIFRPQKKGGRILQPLLLTVMAVPLAYLLLPLMPPAPLAVSTVELIFFTSIITIAALFLERRLPKSAFIFLGLFTAGLITVDTFLGSPLQKTSIMGYDPIVGARFYGIGNEFMGILVGSLIIGCSAVLSIFQLYRRRVLCITGVVFLLVAFMLGNPLLGANLGGFFTAFPAFATTFLLVWGVRFNLWTVLYIALATVILVIVIFIVDLGHSPELQSHFGRNAAVVLSSGWTEVAGIINRKLEMNIKLIKYAIWSRIFIASLCTLALLFFRPVGVVAVIKNTHPVLYKGLIGVIVGSMAALVFNDSGIVAAATTIIFGAPPLIYLVLQEVNQ